MDLKDQSTLLDLLVRVFCIEKFLLEKNLISKEEYANEINALSEKLMNDILKNINFDGNVEDFINKFKKDKN